MAIFDNVGKISFFCLHVSVYIIGHISLVAPDDPQVNYRYQKKIINWEMGIDEIIFLEFLHSSIIAN